MYGGKRENKGFVTYERKKSSFKQFKFGSRWFSEKN